MGMGNELSNRANDRGAFQRRFEMLARPASRDIEKRAGRRARMTGLPSVKQTRETWHGESRW